jgi:hypothetical protein
MTRADWAWVVTCILAATIVAGIVMLSDANQTRPRYGTKYTFITSDDGKTVSTKEEQVVQPVYSTRITIETNGDAQKIVQAAHAAAPDSFIVPSANLPQQTGFDYFLLWLETILVVMLISYVFRIVERVCRRMLRTDAPTNGIVRDPSTGSG